MDYNAYNIAPPASARAASTTPRSAPTTTGRSRRLQPIAAGDEKAEAGAHRHYSASDLLLAFANDPPTPAVAPAEASTRWSTNFDLGDDPLAYYRKRLQLSRELWQRDAGARRSQARIRSISAACCWMVSALRDSPALVAKCVDGMYIGAPRCPAARDADLPYVPVDPALTGSVRRCGSLAGGLFSADSFRFKPEFTRQPDARLPQVGARRPVRIPARQCCSCRAWRSTG